MQSLFSEFCSHASMHGLRYFGDRRRHWSERFWWAIAIGLAIWFCGISVENVWAKWRDMPIKMTENTVPISTIPFPTITICPETKTYKRKLNLADLNELPKEIWNVTIEQ